MEREIQLKNNGEKRLTVNVIHYLFMIDCRLGRVAIWWETKIETPVEIVRLLNRICFE